jgi:hypothetical protein
MPKDGIGTNISNKFGIVHIIPTCEDSNIGYHSRQ